MKNRIVENKETLKDVELLLSKADVLINDTVKKINNNLLELYYNIGRIVVEYKKEKELLKIIEENKIILLQTNKIEVNKP